MLSPQQNDDTMPDTIAIDDERRRQSIILTESNKIPIQNTHISLLPKIISTTAPIYSIPNWLLTSTPPLLSSSSSNNKNNNNNKHQQYLIGNQIPAQFRNPQNPAFVKSSSPSPVLSSFQSSNHLPFVNYSSQRLTDFDIIGRGRGSGVLTNSGQRQRFLPTYPDFDDQAFGNRNKMPSAESEAIEQLTFPSSSSSVPSPSVSNQQLPFSAAEASATNPQIVPLCDTVELPHASYFFDKIDGVHLGFICACSALTIITLLLFMYQLRQILTLIKCNLRASRYSWIVAIFPVTAGCNIVGICVPRAMGIMDVLCQFYFARAVFSVFELMISYFGSRLEMSTTLRQHHATQTSQQPSTSTSKNGARQQKTDEDKNPPTTSNTSSGPAAAISIVAGNNSSSADNKSSGSSTGGTISISTPPICCVFSRCLKPIKPTLINLRRLEIMICQVGLVRLVVVLVTAVMSANRNGLKVPSGDLIPNIIMTAINLTSTMTAMWALMISFNAVADLLKPYRFGAMLRILQILLLIFNFQSSIFANFAGTMFGNLIKCDSLLTAVGKANLWSHLLSTLEMFILSIVASILLRPAVNATFDLHERHLRHPHNATRRSFAGKKPVISQPRPQSTYSNFASPIEVSGLNTANRRNQIQQQLQQQQQQRLHTSYSDPEASRIGTDVSGVAAAEQPIHHIAYPRRHQSTTTTNTNNVISSSTRTSQSTRSSEVGPMNTSSSDEEHAEDGGGNVFYSDASNNDEYDGASFSDVSLNSRQSIKPPAAVSMMNGNNHGPHGGSHQVRYITQTNDHYSDASNVPC